MKKIFHFLGGINFAIFLIFITACFVIAGTFLEARFNSHLYASQWTYSSPLFAILLCLFFINIFFSSLRRWPFKIRHIPFLVTHLGLLMVITGCLIKHWYGLQGNMFILEGSSSQEIVLPYSHSLHVENRNLQENFSLDVNKSKIYKKDSIPQLKFTIQKFYPHVNEKYQSWIKNGYLSIFGNPTLKIQNWFYGESLKKISFEEFDVIAIKTEHCEQAIREAYLNDLELSIKDSSTPSLKLLLSQALEKPLLSNDASIKFNLDLSFAPPFLKVEKELINSKMNEIYKIKLQGCNSLHCFPENYIFSNRMEIDLHRLKPLILFIENLEEERCTIYAFDSHGRIHTEDYPTHQLKTINVYDEGYGGYSIQTKIPFANFPTGRLEKELADKEYLKTQIKQAMQLKPILASPLKLLKRSCEKAHLDFSDVFVNFLYLWDKNGSLLFPEHSILEPEQLKIMKLIEWQTIDQKDFQACQWISLLSKRLEQPLTEGDDLVDFLKKNNWPFTEELIRSDRSTIINQIFEKLLTLSQYLPQFPQKSYFTPNESAHLFSAYLKAFGIDYRSLIPFSNEIINEDFSRLLLYYENLNFKNLKDSMELETQLNFKHTPEIPLNRLEDNRPAIVVNFHHNNFHELISLAYDSAGSGLKMPILNGEFLVKYQPEHKTIPYKVRLHEARQINYADSNQPSSFESDINIYDNRFGKIEKTLSMNHVHETWDGYRFYLSGISSLDSGLKRVQIIVNYDPGKYIFTYPGGIIVSAGIILLFWLQPYKRKK